MRFLVASFSPALRSSWVADSSAFRRRFRTDLSVLFFVICSAAEDNGVLFSLGLLSRHLRLIIHPLALTSFSDCFGLCFCIDSTAIRCQISASWRLLLVGLLFPRTSARAGFSASAGFELQSAAEFERWPRIETFG
jgi:hypothetical protein